MTTQKLDPVKDLRDSVNRVLEQSLKAVTGSSFPIFLDVYETETSVVVRSAPFDGLVADSIEVNMTGNVLLITGETRYESDIPEAAYVLRERRFGTFRRTVEIPAAVNADEAQAKLKDGILTITLPKRKDARPQIIDVEQAK